MVRAPVRLAVFGFVAALAITLLPSGLVRPVAAVSPDLVISQVYGGGGNTGAPFTHDYIELYNRGTAPASLTGLSVQYASATGTGNFGANAAQLTELPAVSVEPGQYYLIQQASNAAVGAPLPTPDHVDPTPITMSGSAGKVVLATGTASLGCNGASTPCTATQLARIIDLVGYGSANFSETAPAPGLSNATADFRADGGCTDTDNNASDFVADAPAPRTTVSRFNFCGEEAPTVTATTPAPDASGVAIDSNISVTFSESVTVTDPAATVSCTSSGTHTTTSSGAGSAWSFDPTPDFTEGETCTVTITGTSLDDADTQDPPSGLEADYVFAFSTVEPDVCTLPATRIHAVQGTGATSSMVNQTVTIQGVVVGDFQPSGSSFNGFHVQEEDGDVDGSSTTSEGIFVFEGSSAVAVAEGDVVRVSGTVGEFVSSGQSLTQITSVTQVLVCEEDEQVTPATVDLPFGSSTFAERYEGMLVAFTPDDDVIVTETFNFGRFGELIVSSDERLWIPTHLVEPGAPAQALQAANDLDRIVVDDGRNDQNIDPTLFPEGGLSAANTIRVGDTMAGGSFVLEQRFGLYRLQPTTDEPDFLPTNARPATSPDVGGDLRVAAMNVLNYFTTFDTIRGSNNGPNICGPLATLECRGANTQFEFDRQRTRIINAILSLDSSVVGLMEIENNDRAATQDLVDGLNDATAPGTWTFVDTGTIGGDAIKVALIYRPADVTPVGAHAILDADVDPRFDDTRSRPALAQTFDADGGGRFTVVVNHLKSKGSACAGDPDVGDGQGNCNVTRTLAAEALVDWIASDPTESGDRDVLVIGDLNSYAREDPVDVFSDAGYVDTLAESLGSNAYSYVFQGQTGYLDHGLASPTLAGQVSGAAEWHINADEPPVLDYNDDFKSANHITELYSEEPYRSSDHDPLIVGLDLLDFGYEGFVGPVRNPPTVNAVNAGAAVAILFTLDELTSLDVLFTNPTSTQLDCTTGAPMGDPVSIATSFGLVFDAETGRYRYEWKTPRSLAGTCQRLELTLDDGTFRNAFFRFR